MKHKAAPHDSKGKDSDMQLSLRMFQLTSTFEATQDQWAEMLINLAAANGKKDVSKEKLLKLMDKHQINVQPTKAAMNSGSGALDGNDQTVIWIDFAIGSLKENNTRKLEEELLKVPGMLERKGYFSFCLTVEEDRDLPFGENILKGYHTVDHAIFDHVDCIGRGNSKKVNSHCLHSLLLKSVLSN